jgi:hypothetical protein
LNVGCGNGEIVEENTKGSFPVFAGYFTEEPTAAFVKLEIDGTSSLLVLSGG